VKFAFGPNINLDKGMKFRMKKLKLLVAMVVCFMLVSPAEAWASSGNHVNPMSPPAQVSPLTIFDPNFKYLDSGAGYLSYLGNGKIDMWGETFAVHDVDSVVVQVILQRWTGSTWVDVFTGPFTIFHYDNYAYDSNIVSVSTGYYYRVKSYHEVTYGSTVEYGTRYSGYIYAS
jgi:hypothetical protein